MKSQIYIQAVSIVNFYRMLFFVGFIVLLCSFNFDSTQRKVTEEKGEVKIQEVKESEPEILTKGHKHHDILAFKIILSPPNSTYGSQIYSVQYFFNLNNTLTGRKAWFSREDDFDKIIYNWMNDSTVAVTLYNSETKAKSETYKLFGFDGGSGLKTND